MEGFKSQKKVACFKEGGQVGYTSRKNHSEEKEMSADIKQDKAIVKKAVGQHEAAKHKGEGKTELKLKTGGRAKKEKGTVKKYKTGGCVKKADGGIIDRLTKNVMGSEAQNEAAKKSLDKVAKQPGALGAVERAIRGGVNAGPYKPSEDDKFVQTMPDRGGSISDTDARKFVQTMPDRGGSISDTDARKFVQTMPYKPGKGSTADVEQKMIGRKKGGKC